MLYLKCFILSLSLVPLISFAGDPGIISYYEYLTLYDDLKEKLPEGKFRLTEVDPTKPDANIFCEVSMDGGTLGVPTIELKINLITNENGNKVLRQNIITRKVNKASYIDLPTQRTKIYSMPISAGQDPLKAFPGAKVTFNGGQLTEEFEFILSPDSSRLEAVKFNVIEEMPNQQFYKKITTGCDLTRGSDN